MCGVCNKPLPKRNKRFCSQDCYTEFQRRAPGAEVLRRLYWDEGKSQRDIAKQLGICESRISVLMKRYKIPIRPIDEATKLGFAKHNSIKRGDKHPRWKGGRIVRSRRYVSVYRPEHPRADKTGYVAEHLLVWEKAHGKLPPEGWIIHHLNGIKSDNRPENLVALPSTKHTNVLRAKAERIKALEAEVRKLKDALEKNQSIFYVA